MYNLIENITPVANWFFLTSLKATIIIALIMIVRLIFRDRLPAKWLHALWFLLIVRLVLPVDMPTPFSLFNLTDKVPYRPALPTHLHFNTDTQIPNSPAVLSNIAAQNTAPEFEIIDSDTEQATFYLSLKIIATFLWFVGVLVLLFCIIIHNSRFLLLLHKAQKTENQRLLAILKRSKIKLNLKVDIRLLTIDQISTPFWFGSFRPGIYFPKTLINSLSNEDLEHIFLHEMAHFKRNDIFVSLVQMILQTMHWFNPFIWYSFWKMRNDREIACDEMVLNALGAQRSKAYGQTLISLLRYANHGGLMTAAVSLADRREDIQNRINRIINFSTKSKWWEAVMLAIVFLISLVALTSATESASISGEVTFQDGAQPDTIYVGLYDAQWNEQVAEKNNPPLSLLKLTNKNTFSFNAEKGFYTLVAWGRGYKSASLKAYLKDDKTDITVNFALASLTLPKNIQHVTLVGDYCRWLVNYVTPLAWDGRVWRTDAPSNMIKGQKYRFLIWEQKIADFYYFPVDRDTPINSRYAFNLDASANLSACTFDHIYAGEKEIVFNASLFKHEAKESIVTTHGCELAQQYSQLFQERSNLRNKQGKLLASRKNSEDNPFPSFRSQWDSLQSEFDPCFEGIFVEEKLNCFEEIWMQKFKYGQLTNAEKYRFDDSAIYENKEFNETFSEIIFLIKKLDPAGEFYSGQFILTLLWQIPRLLETWPRLEQKHNITKRECYDIL